MVPRSLVERYENEAGRKETRRGVRALEYFIGGRARLDPRDAFKFLPGPRLLSGKYHFDPRRSPELNL